jgi:hypothetical protein
MKWIFFISIYFLIVSSTCNNNFKTKEEILFVVEEIKNGENDWYQIQEQFLGKDCTKNKKYASVYLCTKRASGDSIWIISPCLKLKYKENTKAQLFFDSEVKIGDTLFLNIDKDKISSFKNRPKYFGSLKIPTD